MPFNVSFDIRYMSQTDSVEPMFRRLPPDLQREALQYIRKLLEKAEKKTDARLKLDWAGSLEELKGQYSSVSLQKKILDWWN